MKYVLAALLGWFVAGEVYKQHKPVIGCDARCQLDTLRAHEEEFSEHIKRYKRGVFAPTSKRDI